VFVDVAFPVRHVGDAVRRSQHLAGPRRVIKPALRFLIGRRSRTAWRQCTLVAVPHLRIGQANDCAGSKLNRQSNMQQQSANRPALADRPITVRTRPPAAQVQFARVLDHHDVASATRGAVRVAAAHTISPVVTASLRRKRVN